MKYTYFFLLAGTLIFPLLFSFEGKRISYYKKFFPLFLSLLPVALFFIGWDEWFTRMGIWSFNTKYVTGIYFLSLPIEEWLFFIIIPYSCIFIYEALTYFLKRKIFPEKLTKLSPYILSATLFLTGISSYEKIYTFVTFLLTAVFILIHIGIMGSKYWEIFLLTYLIHLIPFFIVNGFLTALPVVSYNDSETLGIRIGTIPLEDSIYSMLLLLMNITLFEFLKEKIFAKESSTVLNHG